MAQVLLRDVHKSYDAVNVLDRINLDINKGEFVVFVGPSGCGKSTLLRLIAGLSEVTDGEISIGNQKVNDLPPAERKIAMVFQSYALYPHMTVAENMGFSLRMAKEKKETIKNKVTSAANILQLEKLLERKPKALSGGQRQRVAIGRAIVREPQVFLFDEPLSNLDAELRVEMRVQIAKLHQQLKTTMIYVTHDQVEAMTMADKIVVLNGGHLQQVGSPLELYHYPTNLFVAGFIGSPKINFIDATCIKSEDKSIEVEVAGNTVKLPLTTTKESGAIGKGQKLILGVRPKNIQISSGGKDWIKFKVKTEVVERLGGISYAYTRLEGNANNLIVEILDDADIAIGSNLNVAIDPVDCYLFTEAGVALQRLTKFNTYGKH